MFELIRKERFEVSKEITCLLNRIVARNENYDNLLNFYDYTEEEIKHFQTKLTHDSLFSNNNFFRFF